MPHQINIFAIKTNHISKNGNIDFGTIVHNSHTANTKTVGSNFSAGDFSPPASLMVNNYVDPDLSDQDQIANPSAPINNSI
jgi:hypothetical protein